MGKNLSLPLCKVFMETIIRKEEMGTMLERLKKVHKCITFAMEIEEKGELLFVERKFQLELAKKNQIINLIYVTFNQAGAGVLNSFQGRN